MIENALTMFNDGGKPPVMGDLTACPKCSSVLEFAYDGGQYLSPQLTFEVVPHGRRVAWPQRIEHQMAAAIARARGIARRRG